MLFICQSFAGYMCTALIKFICMKLFNLGFRKFYFMSLTIQNAYVLSVEFELAHSTMGWTSFFWYKTEISFSLTNFIELFNLLKLSLLAYIICPLWVLRASETIEIRWWSRTFVSHLKVLVHLPRTLRQMLVLRTSFSLAPISCPF